MPSPCARHADHKQHTHTHTTSTAQETRTHTHTTTHNHTHTHTDTHKQSEGHLHSMHCETAPANVFLSDMRCPLPSATLHVRSLATAPRRASHEDHAPENQVLSLPCSACAPFLLLREPISQGELPSWS